MSAMDLLHGLPHLLWTTSWPAGVMAGAIWLACRQWPRMPANLRVMLWWLVSLKFVIGLAWTQPIALPVLPASFDSSSIGSNPLEGPAIGGDSIGSGAAFASDSSRRDGGAIKGRPGFDAGLTGLLHGFEAGVARLLPASGAGLTRLLADVEASLTGPLRQFGIYIAPPARRQPGGLTALAVVVAACWLIGVIVQGALLLRQLARTRRIVARSQPVEGDAAALFDDLVERLGIRAIRPRLRVSTGILTPQVTGLIHPVVLLPAGTLESFTARELTLTFCHELMHVRRFDLWHGWIPSIAARLFFFHPLAHLTAREYAIAREAACDARVLAFTQTPAYDYGRLLMRLGVTAREAAPAAAGASPTLRTLKRRLLMLHGASPHARRLSPRWWALAAIAGLLVIPMRPTAQQRPRENRLTDNQQLKAAPPLTASEALEQAQPLREPQDDGEPWVVLQGDDVAGMHGSSEDLAAAKGLTANASEPLIWFKQDGSAYVIRDPQTLDKAHALFIPQHTLSEKQRELADRQAMLAARQTKLRRTQEALADHVREFDEKVKHANDALAKGFGPQSPRAEVAKQIAQIEATIQQAEATRRNIQKEQEALPIQQHMVSEYQASLGTKQEALALRQEEMARAATSEIRTLLNNAIAAGLATLVK